MPGTLATQAAAAAAGVVGAFGGPVDQEYLFQARQMQALSLGFHIILVCFGVAFPAFVLFVEGLYLRTGDPVYRTLAKRWSKVMLVLFAVGVVSGTILSFELGLLWPRFMAEFGAVFGLAFTLEGFSFFLEAIFIAIYVYAWDRLPRGAHLASGIPIVVAGILGALFVLSVNGWMNNPTGFDLVDGRVTNVDPIAALFNDNLWTTFVHMLLAAYLVAGFVTAGVYAVAWLRGKRDRYHRIALVVPLTAAALAAPAQLVVGDWAARQVATAQPVKLAAIEGLGQTTDGAPLTLLGWYRDGEVEYGIRLPRLLSLLTSRDPSARVAGLDTVPPADRPPVNTVRFAFQTMVGIGFALTGLSLVYLGVLWRRRRLPRSVWFYRAVAAAGPLAVVALISGWITTEVGRQPWIVYEVMRTSEAVTGAGGIPIGYGTLAAVYAVLAVAAVLVLRRMARRPIELDGEPALPPGEGPPRLSGRGR
ncbi:Cytochrome bd-type quinol oxidase subunit 1 [Gaiella occulta]|uniref:Cytochrome bd-type quinol oxidase subunit 1 n=1 Tax=Gaiella occulta TaxID=1002870 RepID=A0A7M2YV94_9ACTN|nr:cytochrome ubiquinol oxidase subunit I [Gaiella occulta]RDI73640.1 Cytochrome bd-type quinol oxidase subunit 1 [Gaiella occulta]